MHDMHVTAIKSYTDAVRGKVRPGDRWVATHWRALELEKLGRVMRGVPFAKIQPWWPDWSGETAIVVAAGPSATAAPLELARGRAGVRVLTINNSWRLAPWADALYACDAQWWRQNAGAPEFAGLKVSQDANAQRQFGVARVRLRHVNTLLTEPGTIGSGGNSGFQGLNLVLQWGVARIGLVGFDMHLAGGVHWHGRHSKGLHNPSAVTVGRWRAHLDAAADSFAALGVEVLNCSAASALTRYRKIPLGEVLAC